MPCHRLPFCDDAFRLHRRPALTAQLADRWRLVLGVAAVRVGARRVPLEAAPFARRRAAPVALGPVACRAARHHRRRDKAPDRSTESAAAVGDQRHTMMPAVAPH